MINFDYITSEKTKEHNPSSPQFPDHPYRIVINNRFGITDSLFNLIIHQPDI